MTRTGLAGIALFVFVANPAFAAEDCTNAATQMAMDKCAGQAFQNADKALNDTYKKLLARVNPASQGKLRDAQRAWLIYRDRQCAFNVRGSADGSVYPMILAQCKTDLTVQQTKELQNQLDCQEGDLSCARQ